MNDNEKYIEEFLKDIPFDAPDSGHRDELKSQLLKAYPRHRLQPTVHTVQVWSTIMKSRIPKLTVAAMIIVAVFIGLNLFSRGGVAWSRVIENVEQVRAYVHRTRITISQDNQPDTNVEFTMYRSVEYGMRRDSYEDGQLISRLYIVRDTADCVEIVPAKKKYVKTMLTEQQRTEMREKQDPRVFMKHLMSFKQKPLGFKNINGRKCEGVEVDDPKFGRMIFETGKGRIWADVETELPVLVELEGTSAGGAIRIHIIHDQFDWAAQLTAEDFEPNIPDDYTVLAEVDLTSSTQTMIKGLRGFSKIADGKYPRGLDIMTANSDVRRAFVLWRQKQGISLEQPPSKEEMDNMLAIQGACMYYGKLIGEDKDVAYYGSKVTAEFPQAVLMRWKCSEDSYCVIFGDLSTSIVTPEELTLLEAKPLNTNLYAIKPEPADGTVGEALTGLTLRWLSGAEAIRNNVYFGTSPDKLSLLDSTNVAECDKVPALERDTTYYWRVDAVSADGKVTPGKVWSFSSGGLVAWWKFDKGSGDVVVDSGPNHLDGAVLGNPSWVAGVLGEALKFDGEGDYVDFGNDSKFNITDKITVAAWIKVDTFDCEWQAIFTKGDGSWRLQRNGTKDSIEFACTGAFVPGALVGSLFGTVNVNDGQWHHVAGTYDGSKICLYVDGSLDVSSEATGSIRINDYNVLIGANAEKPDRNFKGSIDEVRIYNYALSAEEIKDISARQSPAPTE
jgi:hypothetical protein